MLANYHTYKLPRPTTSSTPSKFEGDFEYNARGRPRRQAMRSGWCGGISADLTFCYFLVKQKVEKKYITNRGFTGHEHYNFFKIINMNGRLYDPVICRFFSPDNFVLDNTFTQDFNRYSYARNNPLKYIDPTGQYIVGTDGKPIQYTTYSNDSISWSSNTSADVQRVGNSMLQTNTGTEVFNNMIDAKHPISININKLEQTHSKLGDCFNSISDLSFNPNDIFFV